MASDLILASQSKSKSAERCMRLRWWEYEAPSAWAEDGSVVTRGWEPTKLNLPLSTGGWCHRIVQGLFLYSLQQHTKLIEWMEPMVQPQEVPAGPHDIIDIVCAAYRTEVRSRGLELGLQLDGAIAEEKFIERTIAEQSALIEAFGWAYVRARLPRILEEYEILSVEQEETTPLAGDVVLQSRCDAVLRRRSDGKVFVYNLKTSKDPHRKSWQDQWQYDQQMMTEVLAVERRLGERVYGVIIDGFDKGERVTCWWHNLKEAKEGYSKPPAEGDEKWQRQRSRLLYGYKCEETIPGRPTLYDFEGTTRKGWGPFAVYEEDFHMATHISDTCESGMRLMSSIEYWINWLPPEQVEAAFVTLPPIPRLDQHVEAKVRQIVAQERNIRKAREYVDNNLRAPEDFADQPSPLDSYFPQSSGYQCQFCGFKRVCWESTDPATSLDLFRPRSLNHPLLGEE